VKSGHRPNLEIFNPFGKLRVNAEQSRSIKMILILDFMHRDKGFTL